MKLSEFIQFLSRTRDPTLAPGEDGDVDSNKPLKNDLMWMDSATSSNGNSRTAALWNALADNNGLAAHSVMGRGSSWHDASLDIIVNDFETPRFGLAINGENRFNLQSLDSVDYLFLIHVDRLELLRIYGKGRSSRIWIGTFEEAERVLAQERNLVSIIDPAGFSLLSHAISIALPDDTKSELFGPIHSDGQPSARVEGEVDRRLRGLTAGAGDLCTITEYCNLLSNFDHPPTQSGRYADGDVVQRRFNPGCSAILAFNGIAAGTSRDDFVSSYTIDNVETSRDFSVVPKDLLQKWPHVARAQFDLAYMLAIRRVKLFRSAFGRRVYNIVLPPIGLDLVGVKFGGLVVFPCLNLYKSPQGGFRRTVSITLFVCPITSLEPSAIGVGPRRVSHAELHFLRKQLIKSPVSRAMSDVADAVVVPICAGTYPWVERCSTAADALAALIREVSEWIYTGKCTSTSKGSRNTSLDASITIASAECRLTTVLMLVDWQCPNSSVQPWEDWVAGGSDAAVELAAYRALFFDDFIDPASAYASAKTIRARTFSIGNTAGADLTGVTLFNPNDMFKVCLYSMHNECYPNFSIVRWAAWQIYIDSALTSLRALIQRHSLIMQKTADLRDVIDALGTMIHEFAEFYDLDIREYFYRKEYEKLRAQMQVDDDYVELTKRLSSSKEDELLREQRLINKLILALTIATVSVSVLSTMAQMGAFGVKGYVYWTLSSAALLVWLGYVAFDPIKRALSRGMLSKNRKFLPR